MCFRVVIILYNINIINFALSLSKLSRALCDQMWWIKSSTVSIHMKPLKQYSVSCGAVNSALQDGGFGRRPREWIKSLGVTTHPKVIEQCFHIWSVLASVLESERINTVLQGLRAIWLCAVVKKRSQTRERRTNRREIDDTHDPGSLRPYEW